MAKKKKELGFKFIFFKLSEAGKHSDSPRVSLRMGAKNWQQWTVGIL